MFWVVPAHECFGPRDCARLQVNNGLVVHLQIALRSSKAKVSVQSKARSAPLIKGTFKEANLVATFSSARCKSSIGCADKSCTIACIGRVARDSDRRSQAKLKTFHN